MANFKEKMKRKRKWQERKQRLQMSVDNSLRIVYKKICNLKFNNNQYLINFCLNCIAHRAVRKVKAKIKTFAIIENSDVYEIIFEWGANNQLDMRLEEPFFWYNACREKILGKHMFLPHSELRDLVNERMRKEGFSYKEYKNKDIWTLDLR